MKVDFTPALGLYSLPKRVAELLHAVLGFHLACFALLAVKGFYREGRKDSAKRAKRTVRSNGVFRRSGRLQRPAVGLDLLALLGKNADELETVQESHAMPDHSAQYHIADIGNRELQRNHFPRAEFAGNHRAQTILGNFEAAAVDANVSILSQHTNDEGDFRAIPREAASGRLMHAR
jgi:hypothetical protein